MCRGCAAFEDEIRLTLERLGDEIRLLADVSSDSPSLAEQRTSRITFLGIREDVFTLRHGGQAGHSRVVLELAPQGGSKGLPILEVTWLRWRAFKFRLLLQQVGARRPGLGEWRAKLVGQQDGSGSTGLVAGGLENPREPKVGSYGKRSNRALVRLVTPQNHLLFGDGFARLQVMGQALGNAADAPDPRRPLVRLDLHTHPRVRALGRLSG